MRALLTQPPGGWEHTAVVEVPDPAAGPDEVLVEIKAAGLNPADAFLIGGNYPGGPKPPFIAGRDAAGVVVQADAGGLWPEGTPVVVLQSSKTDLTSGTFCRRQRVSADTVAALPQGWSFAEGAAAPLVYQTAWQALNAPAELPSGQFVLVTGAGGGVGIAAVQLAAGLGATVIALSRSAEKRQRLLSLGAAFAFDPGQPNLKKEIMALTGARGVDVAVENIGGPSLGQSIHLLGHGGRVGVVGLLAGVEGTVPIPSLLFKRASIHGVLVSDYLPLEAAAAWKRISDTLAAAGARPVVDSVFPLDRFPEAFARLKSAEAFGKIVLEMPPAGA
jgi:NADPH2:quinone reductase